MEDNGASAAADQLAGAGLRMLAGTIVDNSGVTRTKVIPVARLRHAERRRRGTRGHSRALTRWRQALSGLVWLRKREDRTALAAGPGVPRTTAYR